MHGRHRWVNLVVTTGLVLGAGLGAGQGAGATDGQREVTVMTQNLYLGSSLQPALTATNAGEFLIAVATIYNTAVFTDFPARAEAIAEEIEDADPDLIALQEVSNWVVTRPPAPAPVEEIDFLRILLDELDARGLSYEEAGTSDNANIGPLPLIAGSTGIPACQTAGCFVTLHDRDVILINDRSGLTASNPIDESYQAQQLFRPPIPNAPAVSFDRGWVSVDVRLDGDQFRFFNTHLEVADFPRVQEQQALELLAIVQAVQGPVIVAGDFNSAADGSTTPTYGLLTGTLTDAWLAARRNPAYTCCQNDTLSNHQSMLDERIDLVLIRGSVRALHADRISDKRFEKTPPLWPSDHAGVVATLQLT